MDCPGCVHPYYREHVEERSRCAFKDRDCEARLPLGPGEDDWWVVELAGEIVQLRHKAKILGVDFEHVLEVARRAA